jgi:uncharacterized protein YjdB
MMFVLGQGNAFAADYTDTDAHWAKESIDKWSDEGLIQGYDGLFCPDNNISRAEIAVIIDRIMDYQDREENTFSDLDNRTWYTDAILKNNLAGVMEGANGLIRPNDDITRQEAVVMLSRALGINPASGNTTFADDASIASWAKGYVKAFSDINLIKGLPGGIFLPTDYITRAGVVKIVDNALGEWITEEAVITTDFEGFVVVNAAGVTLKDLTIDGDLIIAEGVSDGEVYLDNVVVTGDVRVRGGGENSIYLNDCLIHGELTVNKEGGEIRIVASGTTEVKVTTLVSGAILVEQKLEGGGFERVIIPKEIAKASNIILEGSFENIEIKADDITIEILEYTIIDTLTNNGNATINDNRKILSRHSSSEDRVAIIQPESIQITTASSLRTEDIVLLYATILPENTTNKTIVWSLSDESIASIDQDGNLTATSPGAIEITATCFGTEVYDSITVEIIEKTAANGIVGVIVEDDPADITHTILTTPYTYNKLVYKIKNDSTEFDIPFVQDAIDDYIEITNNTTKIETTDGYYIGIYEIDSEDKVLKFEQVQAIVREHIAIIQPESIQITTASSLRTEDIVLLFATILPENTSNKTIVWSVSDESIASINQEGNLTATSPGAIEITATCFGTEVHDSITLEIVEKTTASGIAGVTIDYDFPDTIHTILTTPDTDNKLVYKTKEDNTEFDRPFVKDVLEDYIEITNNTTEIETTDGYYIGIYEIDSEDKVLKFEQVQAIIVQPESIQITTASSLRTEDIVLLSATILPENTSNKTIVWSVSDESIASIDQDGNITATSPGAIEITATCFGTEVYDSITVEIIEKTAANGIVGVIVADDPADITHTILTTPYTDNKLVCKTKNDSTEFDIPFVQDAIDDYIEITNNTTKIETTDGYYIGIYEIDSEDKVLKFEQVQAIVRKHSITNGEINCIEDLCVIGASSEDAAALGYDQSYSLSDDYHIMNDLDFADSSDYRNPSANMDSLSGWSYENVDPLTGISTKKSTANQDGFTPIGEYSGTFNGNYKIISNLYINRINIDYVGLFSKIESSTITDIYFENADITGHDYVGAIAGLNTNSYIISCSTSGNIAGNNYVGGTVGKVTTASCTIVVNACTASGSVSGYDYVGGLIGSSNYSVIIINSNSSADIQGNNYVGGVIGDAIGNSYSGSPDIVMCHSSGNITGANNIGGIAGKVTFTYIEIFGGGNIPITNCSASGNIIQEDLEGYSSSYTLGGLLGATSGNIYIKSSVFIGSIVSNSDNVKAGGITGYAQMQTLNADVYRGDTAYCYSTGEIFVSGSNVTAGGLIGINEGGVSYCYATSNINSTAESGSNKFGGLVGETKAGIKNSIAFNEKINYILGECGRVAGVNNGGSLINNYAYGWMDGADITDGSNTLDGKNGSNIYADSFSDADFYNNSTFWNTNPWNANTSIYYNVIDDRLVFYSDSALENQISDDDGSLFETIPSPVVPTILDYEMLGWDTTARKLPITLPAPDAGNKYLCKVNTDGSLFTIPEIGEVMTGFTEVTDYNLLYLDVKNGGNVGIVEVDSANLAKKFVQFHAVVEYSMNGSGTESDPYQIATVEDLYAIYYSQRTSEYLTYNKIYSLSESYKLKNDLDFANPANYYDAENNMSLISGWIYNGSDIATTKEGVGFCPIGDHYWIEYNNHNDFLGTFNGNSKTIKNLYINRSITSNNYYTGLFGYIESAKILNLNISNAQVQGYGVCGILAGGAYNDYPVYSIIDNCTVQGTVTAYQTAGGIIGTCYYGKISNCTANITIEATKTSYGYAGGIAGELGSEYVGYAEDATINNCNVIGTVKGYDEVDEIAPYGMSSNITNCDISQCTLVILK